MYLLNHACKVAHYKDGSFYFTDIAKVEKEFSVRVNIKIDLGNEEDRFIFMENGIEPISCYISPFGEVFAEYNEEDNTFSFISNDKKYLCYDYRSSGGESLFSFSRDSISLWEKFMLLEEALLDKVAVSLSKSWVSRRNGNLYAGSEIYFGSPFLMSIGPFDIDFRRQKIEDFGEFQLRAFVDSWKVELFSLYNPLIYITAYSSKSVMDQLSICIKSLRKFGDFSGKIVVMTDSNIEHIRTLCDELPFSRLQVDNKYPKDFVGYVSSKFSIINKEMYKEYQPIMYLDPDIVFDRPVEPMLVEATASGKICAALEDFHRLKTHPAIGAGLIQLDHIEVSSYAAGYNGGTIIIPNTKNDVVRDFFDIARRTITNIGKSYGRGFNVWVDQEVINYLSYKIYNVDTSCISKYAKYVSNDPKTLRDVSGFVHFWGHTSEQKSEKMSEYFQKLEKIYLSE